MRLNCVGLGDSDRCLSDILPQSWSAGSPFPDKFLVTLHEWPRLNMNSPFSIYPVPQEQNAAEYFVGTQYTGKTCEPNSIEMRVRMRRMCIFFFHLPKSFTTRLNLAACPHSGGG